MELKYLLKKTLLVFGLFSLVFFNSCQHSRKKNKMYTQDAQSRIENNSSSETSEAEETENVISLTEKLSLHNKKESTLSNFLSDLLQKATQTDLSLLSNDEILINELAIQDYTPSDLPRFFDKKSEIIILNIKGSDLYLFLRIITTEAFSLITPSQQLQYKIIDKKFISYATDLNSDHTLSLWETHRLLSISFSNDKLIKPEQIYSIAITSTLWNNPSLEWFRQYADKYTHLTSQNTQEAIEEAFSKSSTQDYLQKKRYFHPLKPRVIQTRPLTH